MTLKFPTLLGILLSGLGLAVIVSAIRPAATIIGVALGLVGLGLLGVRYFTRNREPKA